MRLKTKYFGEMTIDDSKIINFPEGIPGLEDEKEFIFIEIPENNTFYCLQSTQQEEVAFFLIKPWDFFPDYDIDIPPEELEELEIRTKEDLVLYNIITISNDYKITANLLGPIIINIETLKGKQMILHSEDYQTKHPLLIKERGV